MLVIDPIDSRDRTTVSKPEVCVPTEMDLFTVVGSLVIVTTRRWLARGGRISSVAPNWAAESGPMRFASHLQEILRCPSFPSVPSPFDDQSFLCDNAVNRKAFCIARPIML